MTIDRILGICALGIITVGCMFLNMEQKKRHEELYSLMADHFVYEEMESMKEKAFKWSENKILQTRIRDKKHEKLATKEELDQLELLELRTDSEMLLNLKSYSSNSKEGRLPPVLQRYGFNGFTGVSISASRNSNGTINKLLNFTETEVEGKSHD